MRSPSRRALLRPWAVAIAVAVALPGAVTAHAEPTSPQVRKQLERTAAKLHRAEISEAEITDDLDALQRRIATAELERQAVQGQVAAYARAAYMSGYGTDPMVVLITGDRESDALSKVAMLDQAGRQARATIARAGALHRELRVARATVIEAQSKLAAVRVQLAADGAELTTLFTAVSAREAATEARLETQALHIRTVRLASERAILASKRLKAQRASRLRRAADASQAKSEEASAIAADPDPGDDSDSSEPGPEPEPDPEPQPEPEPEPASGNGGACAVGPANTFRDTWGDRRSGGRRHKGTDIFAPHGSPIYAVVSGVIAGTRSGGLGGKSLILRGDNGDSFYYAHNSSHSVGAGERVRAGERIGSVGATGNAAGGAAHVHFEKWPGGGRPRNPYGFLRQLCG